MVILEDIKMYKTLLCEVLFFWLSEGLTTQIPNK